MKQISIREQDEFIKLGQALKKANLVSSGVEAKIVIQDGQVTVNGETELQSKWSKVTYVDVTMANFSNYSDFRMAN